MRAVLEAMRRAAAEDPAVLIADVIGCAAMFATFFLAWWTCGVLW